MEINGSDIVFSTEITAKQIVEFLTSQWPLAVVEGPYFFDPKTGQHVLGSSDHLEEWFIYRDGESKMSWDVDGWTEWNSTQMIHVLKRMSKKELTIVHDNNQELLNSICEHFQITPN